MSCSEETLLDDRRYFEDLAREFMEEHGLDPRTKWNIFEGLTEVLQEIYADGLHDKQDQRAGESF
jgi:hypothetical protein